MSIARIHFYGLISNENILLIFECIKIVAYHNVFGYVFAILILNDSHLVLMSFSQACDRLIKNKLVVINEHDRLTLVTVIGL